MSAKPWNPSKYVKKRVLRILVSALVAIAVCCIGFILNQRKAIALEVDGKTKEVVTYTDSLPKFLKQQGITVHTHDQAVSSSGYWLTNGAVVKVRRAYEVMVNIGGHLIPYWTLASSAEQLENYFLQNDKEAAKISVNIPNVYNALTGGINLNASGPIEVIAFGKSYNVKNGNQPAASILDSLGITITSNDLVSVEHTGGKTILVVERVSYGTETQDVMTAYSVKTVDNPNAYVGTTTIKQKGSYGEQQQTLKVTYINGKPVASQLMGAKVIKQSQPEIIEVGTKKKPAPKPVEPKKEESEPKAQSSTQDQKKQQAQPQQQKSQPAQKPAQNQSQPKKEESEPKAQSSTQDQKKQQAQPQQQKSQPAQKPAQNQSQPKKEESEPKAQSSTQDQKKQQAQPQQQ
ncbi:MAG: G5 domain-containing protein, partial [Aeriscardovia sp.]|nr:G5 domain-containing protein [Aeriscardovia sp.]